MPRGGANPRRLGRLPWLGWAALTGDALLSVPTLLATYAVHWSVGRGLVITGDVVTTIAPVLVAYALGAYVPRVTGLVAGTVMAVVGELNVGYVNPFVLVVTFGPFIVGAMVRDRSRLAHQLAVTAEQLEAESRVLAEESVRLERSRLAHELHDIVAHCVSVMVVQAYAGERLASEHRASASEAFDHISDAAAQAQLEIGRLVELLAAEPAEMGEAGLASGVGALVASALAAGLSVRLHIHGDAEALPPAVSRVAYRTIQESITNAPKHAPGAPIDVSVCCHGDAVEIRVVNPVRCEPVEAPLHESGGGHGLAGMRARVDNLGGELSAERHHDATWVVSALLPLPAE